MPVEIIITGDTAAHAITELREFSSPFYQPSPIGADEPMRSDGSAGVATQEPVVEAVTFTPATGAITSTVAKPPKATRTSKAKGTPAPVVQEDSPEVQAQDAADEAAEAAAAAPEPAPEPAKTLSHEDIRGALGAYSKKFGLPAAQEDGPKMLQAIVPDVRKISDLPVDQETLGKALAAIQTAMEQNPYGRKGA